MRGETSAPHLLAQRRVLQPARKQPRYVVLEQLVGLSPNTWQVFTSGLLGPCLTHRVDLCQRSENRVGKRQGVGPSVLSVSGGDVCAQFWLLTLNSPSRRQELPV